MHTYSCFRTSTKHHSYPSRSYATLKVAFEQLIVEFLNSNQQPSLLVPSKLG
jgi:hypothetical protein